MKKAEIRILEMLIRVRQFVLTRIAAFPANLPGHDLYLVIDASIKSMERLSGTQGTHTRAGKEKTVLMREADAALRDLMEDMSHTARSMKRNIPGVEEKFRLPSNKDGQVWLAAGRGFATEGEPLAEEFVARGMPTDFIDDLKARILAVEGLSGDRAEETDARIGSTTGVGRAADEGLKAVRDLDPIVRNIYKGNEAELAAWESASHVERAPRRAAEDEEEPPAEPAPAQA